jgi:hypothetical protein
MVFSNRQPSIRETVLQRLVIKRQHFGGQRQLQAQKSPHWAGKGHSNFEWVNYRVGGCLGIGRLRQGMCRVRLQTAACDVGIWSGCGDTKQALWLSNLPI